MMNNQKPKILILATNRAGWHSGNKLYDYAVVAGCGDSVVYGPGYDYYRFANVELISGQIYGGQKPDIIYSYYTPEEQVKSIYVDHYKIIPPLRTFPINFKKYDKIKRVYGLSDFWHRTKEQWNTSLLGSTFKYCFCCFAPPYCDQGVFNTFFSQEVREEIKFMALPRAVDKYLFKDYGLDKVYDVAIMGNIGSHFYPFRKWMHDELTNKASEYNIKYKNFPHSGFGFKHNGFVRKRYAMAINQSKILVSCGGIYHLAMNKIFEAMGCGTLYIGEKPAGEHELGLKDGFNYVAVTKDNFWEKLNYYLKHEDERFKIIENAKETFKKHTIEARTQDCKKLINEVLNESNV